MSKLSLPDFIVLNEVRIPKRNLVSIPVRKCYFAPNNRRAIGKIIRERELVAVFSGQNIVYLAKTKQNTKLSEDIGLDIRDEIKTFSDLPEEIARQFVFALIQKVIEKQGLFRGDGFQFVSFQEKFPNGFKAFDLDIRDNPDHYSIFIDPTILVMLPISKFPKENLKQGRLFMKVITPNNKEKIREWKHSPYSGRAGFFEKFDNAEIMSSPHGLNENDVVLVRRTSSSDDLVPYPAFAIRVIAKRDEIEALSLSVKERRMYQPLSKIRLSETKRWINQIFSGGTLSINDRSIQIEDMTSSFKKMETYRVGVSHSNIWYPETPLMFDPLGTKNTPFQLIGLRNYGPFDKNARSRSFTSIKPYLIIPNNPELIGLSNEFFQYLSNGYTKRINTDFGDIDFDGLGKHFYIDFVPPSPLDTTIIDSGSIEEYVQAANDLLIRWAGQDARDENRIAIVVVPNRYEDEDEGDDPYVDLKRYLYKMACRLR